MKVRELIKMLKTMPKDLYVYMADHDHGTYETNNSVNRCELINKDEMTEGDNDSGDFKGDCAFKNTPHIYVVVRP